VGGQKASKEVPKHSKGGKKSFAANRNVHSQTWVSGEKKKKNVTSWAQRTKNWGRQIEGPEFLRGTLVIGYGC